MFSPAAIFAQMGVFLIGVWLAITGSGGHPAW